MTKQAMITANKNLSQSVAQTLNTLNSREEDYANKHYNTRGLFILDLIVESMVQQFKATIPNFNSAKFRKDCGL